MHAIAPAAITGEGLMGSGAGLGADQEIGSS